jgi:hypothetical protein
MLRFGPILSVRLMGCRGRRTSAQAVNAVSGILASLPAAKAAYKLEVETSEDSIPLASA